MASTFTGDIDSSAIWSQSAMWPTGNGDHWSKPWGGSAECFRRSIKPRLPTYSGIAVEIGCGHGQWQPFFGADWRGIDCNSDCVRECQRLYGEAACVLTDGKTIPFDDVGLVFSWNTLTGSCLETLANYVRECGRVLTADGVAFIHHADNQEELADVIRDAEMFPYWQERIDWPSGAARNWFTTFRRTPCENHIWHNNNFRDEWKNRD